MVDALDALMTRTPTPLRWSSACSILTRSSRWLSMRGQRAGQLLERGVDAALLLAHRDREPVERVDRVDDVGLVVVELGHQRVGSGCSTERAEPSRPCRALLSSCVDGLELRHAAAVEQQAERAEHLLDLGVATGPLERDHVAAAQRVAAGAAPAARSARRTSRPAGWSGGSRRSRCRAAWCRCASRASRRRGSPSSETSVTWPTLTSLTLTVDFGTRSSTSGNSTFTVIGLPPDVGAAGQRQLVDVEAPQPLQHQRPSEQQACRTLSRGHRRTSTSPPSVWSKRSWRRAARRVAEGRPRSGAAPA